ncbi:MAG: DUF4160 domain-containing protein [Candidatus Kuenenia sp.]|nr:DUF4160 domain-containing protein [Candidatus Kuenenia sp.]
MPRISIFFGIVIYMYYDDHNPPHFHASYEGLEGMFNFEGNLIKGYMPLRAKKLIKEWCNCHKNELEENWENTKYDKPLNWIEPLR